MDKKASLEEVEERIESEDMEDINVDDSVNFATKEKRQMRNNYREKLGIKKMS